MKGGHGRLEFQSGQGYGRETVLEQEFEASRLSRKAAGNSFDAERTVACENLGAWLSARAEKWVLDYLI